MGGRASDESKSRATQDAVREAQAAWHRLPPVENPEARGYAMRFREACRRLTADDRRPKHQAPRHAAKRDDREPATV